MSAVAGSTETVNEVLREVSSAARAVEEAVAAGDWPQAEATDAALQHALGVLDGLLAELGSERSQAHLAPVTACLAEALERYERATARVGKAREDVAAELRTLRSARRGAARYRQAADS
jgi:type VI protein secretion system component VasF